VTFAWRSAAPGATYRLSLTDPAGALAWTEETTDTLAVVPDSVSVAKGDTYFWFVDTTLPSGEVATTGIQEFVVR
jgi:hypothetical protein